MWSSSKHWISRCLAFLWLASRLAGHTEVTLFQLSFANVICNVCVDDQKKDELLQRWFQLASMQPFMMVYTEYQQNSTLTTTLREAIRNSVKNRYRFLPYFYTQFYKAHVNGDLVWQPLFIQFANDTEAYKIMSQYMIGPSLMVTPPIQEGQTTANIYFPQGRW